MAQAAGRPRLWRLRKGHAQRTANMNVMSVTLDVSRLSGWLNADKPNIEFMSVTLDVSKLSGWLNAVAPCRV